MKKLMLPAILLMLIYACTTFDTKDHNASVSASDKKIKRVAVVDFDFARPERGRTDRDMAMTNSAMIAHAASQDAIKDLLTQLGK